MCSMRLVLGYGRTSTTDQHGKMQFEALIEAGVPEEHIYFDQLSGAKAARDRPALTKLLAYARDADTVWWSFYEPRWASFGLWNIAGLTVAGDPEPLTMAHDAVQDAAALIRRLVS
jgi:hypothetical protein